MFDELIKEKGLSLERLVAFLQVAQAGGFAAAAPKNPVRQSQYSTQVKELSKYFGVQLVKRTGRGATVTSEGQMLARLVKVHLIALRDIKLSWQNRP